MKVFLRGNFQSLDFFKRTFPIQIVIATFLWSLWLPFVWKKTANDQPTIIVRMIWKYG